MARLIYKVLSGEESKFKEIGPEKAYKRKRSVQNALSILKNHGIDVRVISVTKYEIEEKTTVKYAT